MIRNDGERKNARVTVYTCALNNQFKYCTLRFYFTVIVCCDICSTRNHVEYIITALYFVNKKLRKIDSWPADQQVD